MTAGNGFGPWAHGISSAERIARLRSMQALALVYCAGAPEFADALAAAETDTDSLRRAWLLLDYLPALSRRRLATYDRLVPVPAKPGSAP